MPRLTPLEPAKIPDDLKPLLEAGEALMGFAPNDGLTMARRPDILRGLFALIQSIYGGGLVDPGLKRLIGEAASKAAGCTYCEAHASFGALRQGVPEDKIAAVWTFETSPLFDAAERAALRVAMAASRTPNETTDAEFEELRAHFSEAEIVEILSVIAMFGFLNRWNSTVATELEQMPASLRRELDRREPAAP